MKLKYLGDKKAKKIKKIAKKMAKSGKTLSTLAPKEKFTFWQKIKNHIKGLFYPVKKFNNPQ